MRFTDAAHLGLMLFALALTYVMPFELLLLAYVVLGPPHYATEISWLHDRKYFLPQGVLEFRLNSMALPQLGAAVGGSAMRALQRA